MSTPTTDSNYTACKTTAGNSLPPQASDVVDGQIGDPSDPTTYVPFLVGAYSKDGAAWVCLEFGTGFQRRVIVPASSASAPSVTPRFDAASATDPSAPSGHTGYPSNTCQVATTGTKRQLGSQCRETRRDSARNGNTRAANRQRKCNEGATNRQ